MLKEALRAPDRWTYTDLATTAPDEAEFDTLDLYHATDGGKAALVRKQRDDALRSKAKETSHIAGSAA